VKPCRLGSTRRTRLVWILTAALLAGGTMGATCNTDNPEIEATVLDGLNVFAKTLVDALFLSFQTTTTSTSGGQGQGT
jgi:hypothetical protein